MKHLIALPLALLAVSACDQERPFDPALPEPASAPLLQLAPGATATIDFENLALTSGQSVEGLGTVHSLLNIKSTTPNTTAALVQTNITTGVYIAGPNAINVGCLGNPGGWTGPGSSVPGKGFAIIGAQHPENYEFTFAPGITVSSFSMLMVDWGDFNPTNDTEHEVKLTAYDASGSVVDEHRLFYTSGGGGNPRGNQGDACTAQPGQPGNFTFSLSGPGIVKVTLTSGRGYDPNIALDNISFTRAYDFNGFFPPIENLPVMNVVKAGQGIPVKFSLGGDLGLDILAPGSPYSVKLSSCSAAETSPVLETVSAGGSSLTYDAAADRYIYIWKTDRQWAGTCRQLIVKLADGTEHRANFDFTR